MALGRQVYGSSDGRKVRWSYLVIVVIVLGVVWFGYRKYINMTLTKGNTLLEQAQLDDAKPFFSRVQSMPFTNGLGEDGLGVIALLNGDSETAKNHFRVVLEKKPGGFGADPQTALNLFIDQGKYNVGAVYRDFLSNWKKDDDLAPFSLEFSILSLGVRELDEAKAHLDGIDEGDQTSARFKAHKERMSRIEQDGYIPVILDRNQQTILRYNFSREAYEYVSPKLFEGWGDPQAETGLLADLSEEDRYNHVVTTLDSNLQKAAYQAMRKFKGTMIMLEPQSGDILAAYGSEGYHPFQTAFEPGSVIKVLTYMSYLKDSSDVSKYAPKNYPSFEKIGGKIFYDWTPQGRLETVDEGMAVSCNLMFARMGIDLGWPKLSEGIRDIFRQPADLEGLPKFASFGRMVREPENAYELGRISIGLDLLETTSLGLALIPATLANDGAITPPRFYHQGLNMEREVYLEFPAPGNKSQKIFDGEVTQKAISSMEAALTFTRGTARRAEVDFVTSAMKTGTAGDRPFDAIMIGLFPSEEPKLAFAFFLASAGKCEIYGAQVAKNLQEQIQALAPEYLEP
jgi:hypothetical protein